MIPGRIPNEFILLLVVDCVWIGLDSEAVFDDKGSSLLRCVDRSVAALGWSRGRRRSVSLILRKIRAPMTGEDQTQE
jgi:hypothetical protein